MAVPSTNGFHVDEPNGASNDVSNIQAAPASLASTPPANKSGLVDLMVEAQSFKDSARDLYNRANGLVGAIKRHRKQSNLVATTLASLRQLQKIDA